MSDVIGIDLIDNVNLRIECDTSQAFELKEFFSCYVPNYKFNPKYKARMWDGKISFFNVHDRTLPIGLLKFIKPFLVKYDYKVHFMFDRTILSNDLEQKDLLPFYDALYDGLKIYPRDYQQEAIFAALKNKRGVLESATGSGKSIIIYSLIRYMMEDVDGKVLLVVPSINLVNQMFSDFSEYGWYDSYDDVTLLYGKSKNYDPNKKVLISTWQSVYKKTPGFFKQFGGVLVDETHGAKSASIQTVLKKCTNAEYKLGLTGTLPTEKVDRYNIFGYLGPVIYKLKSKELIDRGYLTDIKIVNMHVRYPQEDIQLNKSQNYAEEIDLIINKPERQRVLKYIMDSKYVSSDQNTLILAQRINHIDNIVEYLQKEYPEKEILRIDGKTDPDERERVRKYVESNDGIILVATYGTLSTGVNIPKIHHVIFASFYKSKIKVLQSIGRGLRKHKSKDIIIIWDLIDDMRWEKKKRKNSKEKIGLNYAYQHFLERLEFYKDQGFKYINKKITLSDL